MRLLHIIPSLEWGSAEQQLQILLRGLPADRFEQHLVMLRGSVPPNLLPTERVQTLGLVRNDISACRAIQRCVSKLAPDIVHSWRAEAGRLTAASCLGLAIRHLASIWRWPEDGDWLSRTLDRIALLSANAKLAPQWMDSSPRFPGSGLVTVGYGVATGDNQQRKRHCRDQIIGELGIPADAKLVGFIGPLVRENRVKDAIWAADLLKVVRDDVHLLVVGRGPMAGRLKAFRRQAQVQDRVHFVVQPERMEAALDAVDCVWVTGQSSLGVPTLLEAQARRIPVIATDLPCHRRFVTDQRTGLIVNVGYRAGFARRTFQLFEEPEMASRIASAASEFAHRICDVTRVIDEYQRLYQKALRGLR